MLQVFFFFVCVWRVGGWGEVWSGAKKAREVITVLSDWLSRWDRIYCSYETCGFSCLFIVLVMRLKEHTHPLILGQTYTNRYTGKYTRKLTHKHSQNKDASTTQTQTQNQPHINTQNQTQTHAQPRIHKHTHREPTSQKHTKTD